jgi:hypothetical protein
VDLSGELPDAAGAVVINLTATGALGDGYLTAYTCGESLPGISNLNYVGVTTIANSSIVMAAEDLSICIQTGDAATDVLVDVVGFYPLSGGFIEVEPQRVLDTRASEGGRGPVEAGGVIELDLDPDPSLPDIASAAIINLTATGAQGDGYLTVYACDDDQPGTSSLNYVGVTTIAGTAITEFSHRNDGNRLCIYVGDAATDILVDYVGLIARESPYTPLPPERQISTRISDGGNGPVEPGTEIKVPIIPPDLIPDFGAAVMLNITATGARGNGYLTAYACGDDRPDTSNLNYVGVTTVANASIVEVGDTGVVCIYVGDAATDLLVDSTGLFIPAGGVIEGDFPDVYTRVTNYLDWIDGITKTSPGDS